MHNYIDTLKMYFVKNAFIIFFIGCVFISVLSFAGGKHSYQAPLEYLLTKEQFFDAFYLKDIYRKNSNVTFVINAADFLEKNRKGDNILKISYCDYSYTYNLNCLFFEKDTDPSVLYYIRKLKIIDDTQKIKKIGSFFLANFDQLRELDLSALTNIQKIKGFFLYKCKRLKKVDLPSLSSVKKIGPYFLKGCKSLKTLDLSSLTGVKKIEKNFLKDCPKLHFTDLPDNFFLKND